MFTGIITATAKVTHTKKLEDGIEVVFTRPKNWDDVVIGESIAVNGVCLTVTDLSKDSWSAVMMPETLAKTSFKTFVPKRVNIERAMQFSERLSGHIVQGHVDTTGTVSKIDTSDGHVVSVEFANKYRNLVIDKGSITIDGVSLTVTNCRRNTLQVALIPHTLDSTTLSDLQEGDRVNLEFDVIGKYVAKIIDKQNNAKS